MIIKNVNRYSRVGDTPLQVRTRDIVSVGDRGVVNNQEGEYNTNNMKSCVVCSKKLIGLQRKYCSKSCEVRGWKLSNPEAYFDGKRRYRKVNAEKINAYNREYRARGSNKRITTYAPTMKTRRIIGRLANHECQRCGDHQNLQMAHVEPHWHGGSNKPENLLLLCQACHQSYDSLFREFWDTNGDSHNE